MKSGLGTAIKSVSKKTNMAKIRKLESFITVYGCLRIFGEQCWKHNLKGMDDNICPTLKSIWRMKTVTLLALLP